MSQEDNPSARNKPRVQTAARTAALLQEVGRSGSGGITAKKLSEQLQLPRQVVYHLVHTLMSVGMLRRSGTGYVLGLGVGVIAQGFRRQLSSATDGLGRYAAKAAKATGETAYVVGWLDTEIVVLSSRQGGLSIQAAEVPQGTTGDAHARASGKLLLAMASQEERDEYLASHPLVRRTPGTIVDKPALLASFSRILERQTATDLEEYELGLCCMAVPLGGISSQLALGISAPADRFRANEAEYERLLKEIAGSDSEETS